MELGFTRKNIIKKIVKNLEVTDIKEELEENFNQLNENVFYGQQLVKTGSWTHDLINKDTFWTDEIYSILECSHKELDDKLEDFYSYIHPDDVDETKKVVQFAFEDKEYDIEYRIITSTGVEKYLHEKTKVLYDENNKPVKIIGTIQDITEQKIIENNLKVLGEDLNLAQRIAGVGIWKYDLIKNKIFWSEEVYRIYGIKPEEYDGTYEAFLKIVHPEDVKTIENMVQSSSKKPFKLEFRVIRSDGSMRYVHQQVEFIFDKGEKPIYIYGTIQDITEKKELQKEIKSNWDKINMMQRRFQIFEQEPSDVFEIIDPDGTIKHISESVNKIIGYKSEERIGKKVYEFSTREEQRKLTKMIELVLSVPGKKVQGDIIFKADEEKDIYLAVQMENLLHDPAVEGIVINYKDITKRIEMEKKISYISTHDRLTGLPNSVSFSKKLKLKCQHAKETNTRFALMMLDIDGLKYVNYSLGYEFGKQLIIEIVQRLEKFLGKDIFISRYSEDHFAIIIEGLNTHKEYENIAKGIINLFSTTYKIWNYEIDVNANIGICIYPNDTQDKDSLRKQSKLALLRAKKEGKNKYKFYSSDLDVKNYKEFILRSDLHNAIEKEELRTYYQPIINLKNNKILGAEALIRWEHSDWGMISPSEFIYLAEETSLIIDIGKWMLREVCKHYKQWQKNGLSDIKISVNFSGIQFLENDFVKNIKDIIDECDLEPSFLIVEITESILMKNTDKVIYDIKKLQSLGIQVALDDFGTGFSSLSYLTSFNIDILKLDGSFIMNIPIDETSTSITKSVVNLAKELKIKLVVEGIEKKEQLSYLKKLNCYTGQGFIYSKPVPLEDFEKILVKKKCKPLIIGVSKMPNEDRRKFFRIDFTQLLESDLTILRIMGNKVNVGDTKVLIKDIGPGGLCFISNIKFPIKKEIVLQFTTQLIETEIKVYGHPVWTEEIDYDLYEYGIEFTIDENERMDLIKELNQAQIKIKKNTLFADGRFISGNYIQYFASMDTRN